MVFDGKDMIVFRDMAAGSPTYGHFVAWVSRYEDILSGSRGQYRIKLLHCHRLDTGYPGIEILPDETIVATTYVAYRPDEMNSVVSVRFRLDEFDRKCRE